MKRLLLAVLSGLALAGCGSSKPPVVTQFDNSSTFDAPFDSVWTALIETFADNLWTIATIEKASGLVVTERMQAEPRMADCGTVNDVAVLADMGRFNVFVKPAGNRTEIRVNCSFTGSMPGLRSSRDCKSRGVVEKMVLEGVRTRLGRDSSAPEHTATPEAESVPAPLPVPPRKLGGNPSTKIFLGGLVAMIGTLLVAGGLR